MLALTLLVSVVSMVLADVSHLLQTTTSTEPPPAKPYVFSYTAGRFPGHADRQHTEVSDGSGVIRGSFSYVDPRQEVRTVDYVADKQGFHPVLSVTPPDHPADSKSVERAKNRHYQLYAQIAEQQANNPHPQAENPPPEHLTDSEAVARANVRHYQLYQQIAEQHANNPHPQTAILAAPRQSAAVAAATVKHAHLFQVIAEQHARIAAEREALQREEEEEQSLQELHDQH